MKSHRLLRSCVPHVEAMRSFTAQSGVALIVGLLILLVLTLLATAGMSIATLEVAMAGNEQAREKASLAAESGIELALAGIGNVAQVPSAVVHAPRTVAAPDGSSFREVETRFVATETNLPASSAEKLLAHHYEIKSTGTATRGARDVQVLGAMIIRPTSSMSELHGVGSGLQE
jgi:type IV pilus assembly protein PilX